MWENGYIESFHGKFREKFLNEHWFLTLDDARETIESWRIDYNQVRPLSSLGYLTPEEFATGYANVESKERFHRPSWCDEVQCDPVLIFPLIQSLGGELRAFRHKQSVTATL